MQVDSTQRPSVTRKYSPFRRMARDSLYPIVQSYKGTGAPACGSRSRIRCSSAAAISRPRIPGRSSLPSAERPHLQTGYERGDWRGGLGSTAPTSTISSVRPGRAARATCSRRTHACCSSTTYPSASSSTSSGRSPATSTRCPTTRTWPWTSTVCHRHGPLSCHDVRNSLGNVDDEKGNKWSVAARPSACRAVPFLASRPRRIRVSPPSGSTRRCGCAAPQASRLASRTTRLPISTSAHSATTGSTTSTRSGTGRFPRFPGAALNGIGGRNFVKTALELNLPPWRFGASARPGLHATWLRPAVFVGGLATNLDDDSVRRRPPTSARRWTCGSPCCPTMQLTLSFGGAIAFEDGRSPRREAMISLKVLR